MIARRLQFHLYERRYATHVARVMPFRPPSRQPLALLAPGRTSHFQRLLTLRYRCKARRPRRAYRENFVLHENFTPLIASYK